MLIINGVQMYVKPYCYKELISLYGVSHKTFKNWIYPFTNELGEKRGRYFTVKQVELIFQKIGFPNNIPFV